MKQWSREVMKKAERGAGEDFASHVKTAEWWN